MHHPQSQRQRLVVVAVLGLALCVPTACDDDGEGNNQTNNGAANNGTANNGSDGGDYDPEIPSAWSAEIDNAYLPLKAGSKWEYTGTTEDGTETIVVEVLDESRTIRGVEATVVRDTVSLEGVTTEDTYDWFAQDEDGNVWYLGEDSTEFEDGEPAGKEGSWEWGVDGALPGIVMWAQPAAHVDEEYRQEYFAGEAEDWGKVVETGVSVEVPAGSYTDCIRTEDWNALEPGVLENKWYCPNVGTVKEEAVEGDQEIVELETFTP